LVLPLLSCGNPEEVVITFFSFTPPSITTHRVSPRASFVATAFDQHGIGQVVTVQSSDSSVVTVEAGYRDAQPRVGPPEYGGYLVTVTAHRDGQAILTASAGNRSVTATVIVDLVATGARISPDSARLVPGDQRTLLGGPVDSGSTSYETSDMVWSSSNPAAVTVDQSGTITAVAPGSSSIALTTEGFTVSIPVSVVAP
jgi:uncharacterized protein YjdB